MKKFIYVILIIVTILLIGYTGYYSLTKSKTPLIAVATTTEELPTEEETPDPNVLITSTGKKITVKETNPAGSSLSTITITSSGFATNTPFVLEKNKLTSFFVLDINNDAFDELVLITTSAGSGSYGEAIIYTTSQDKELRPVLTREITEDDTKKGALFEGYMGHDTFGIDQGSLLREFPSYKKTDANNSPTGQVRRVMYTLTEQAGIWSTSFVQSTSSTSTPLQIPSTPLQLGTSTSPKEPLQNQSEGLDLE